MKRKAVITTLKRHQDELADRFGVNFLALFGSVARDQAVESSDVDILVEFNRPIGLFGLFALQDYLAETLGCPVDVGTPDSLKPRIRAAVLSESVRVI